MLSAEVDTILLRDLHNFSHYKEAEFDNHKVLLLIQRFLSSWQAFLLEDFLQNFGLFLGTVSGYKYKFSHADTP